MFDAQHAQRAAHNRCHAARACGAGQQLGPGEAVSESFEENFARFRIWHDAIAPLSLGVENIPTRASLGNRPILFVGNHTQFGMYDMPLLFMELYVHGYKLTGLAHPEHWKTPLGSFFEDCGAIKASPLAAYRALRRGSNVLLFPGASSPVMHERQLRLLQPLHSSIATSRTCTTPPPPSR